MLDINGSRTAGKQNIRGAQHMTIQTDNTSHQISLVFSTWALGW